MLLHYKNQAKKTCGLLIQFDTGSFNEPKGYEGFTHFAEHLIFTATKKFTNPELSKRIENIFDYIQADTRRDTVTITCTFNIIDFNEVLETLQAMVFNWQCPKSLFAKEKKMILNEANEYYKSEYGKNFLHSFSSLPIKDQRCPLGTITQLKKITFTDLPKINKFWSNQIKKNKKHCVAIGAGFDKKHLEKIKKTFDLKNDKQPQTSTKESKIALTVNKNTSTLFFNETKYNDLYSFLYRIYYARWFNNFFDPVEFSAHTVDKFWFCTLVNYKIEKNKFSEFTNDFFFKTPTKEEFCDSKKTLIKYLYKVYETCDLVESLDFMNYDRTLKQTQNIILNQKEIIKHYQNITYKEFLSFFKEIQSKQLK